MMRMPGAAAIDAAERRLEQSRRDARERRLRVRLACRAALAKPVTLALAAGAAFVVGYRVHGDRHESSPEAAVRSGRIAVVAALAFQYTMRHFAHGWLRKLAASRVQGLATPN